MVLSGPHASQDLGLSLLYGRTFRRPSPQPKAWRLSVKDVLSLVGFLSITLFCLVISWDSRHGGSDGTCGPGSLPADPAWLLEALAQQSRLKSEIARLEDQILVLTSQEKRSMEEAIPSLNAGFAAAGEEATSSDVDRPFLFVGVLSSAGSKPRRDAIRGTWMGDLPPGTQARFVLYEEERDDAIQKESEAWGDLVFVPSRGTIDYRSIVFKVSAMFEWVVLHLNPNFILKTDDDAYVNCAALIADLKSRCESSDCRNERIYMGEEKRRGQVITDKRDKWSNEEYWEHTHLREYFPYMFGGGYVVSSDIARALHVTNRLTGLKIFPNEDATFGFWVSGLNLRRISHPGFHTSAGTCCLTALDWEGSQTDDGVWRTFWSHPSGDRGVLNPRRSSTDLWLMQSWEPLCAGWMVLHKVENAAMMHFLHSRLSRCDREMRLLDRAAELVDVRRSWNESINTTIRTGDQKPNRRTAASWQKSPGVSFLVSDVSAGFQWPAANGWRQDGREVLVYRIRNDDASTIEIGVLDLTVGSATSHLHATYPFRLLGNSSAWNWREGAHALWIPEQQQEEEHANARNTTLVVTTPPRVLFNTWSELNRVVTVVVDAVTGVHLGQLPREVVALSSDGTLALSSSLERLGALVPDLALRRKSYSQPKMKAITTDGLWLMRLTNVDYAAVVPSLVLSYRAMLSHMDRIATTQELKVKDDQHHIINRQHQGGTGVHEEMDDQGNASSSSSLPWGHHSPLGDSKGGALLPPARILLPPRAATGCGHAFDSIKFVKLCPSVVVFQYLIGNCHYGERSLAYMIALDLESSVSSVPHLLPTPSHKRAIDLDVDEGGRIALCYEDRVDIGIPFIKGCDVRETRNTQFRTYALPHLLAKDKGRLTSCAWAPGVSGSLAITITRHGWSTTHTLAVWRPEDDDLFLVGHHEEHSWPANTIAGLGPVWSPDAQALAIGASSVWDVGLQTFLVGVGPAQAWTPRINDGSKSRAESSRMPIRSNAHDTNGRVAGIVGVNVQKMNKGNNQYNLAISQRDDRSVPEQHHNVSTPPAEGTSSKETLQRWSLPAKISHVAHRKTLVDVTGGRLAGWDHVLCLNPGNVDDRGSTSSSWRVHAVGGVPRPTPNLRIWEPPAVGESSPENATKSSMQALFMHDKSAQKGQRIQDVMQALLRASEGDWQQVEYGRTHGSTWRDRLSSILFSSRRQSGTGLERLHEAWLDESGYTAKQIWRPSWKGRQDVEQPEADAAAKFVASVILAAVQEDLASGGDGRITLALALPGTLQHHILESLILDGNILHIRELLVSWPIDVPMWSHAQLLEAALGIMQIPWQQLQLGCTRQPDNNAALV